MTTISEMFQAADSDTVTHRGRVVKALVRLPVRDGATITVRRRQASPDRPQGLKIGLDTGVLDVNGCQAKSVVLWTTSSPEEVVLAVRGERATSVDIWNCWSMGGVDSAWVGNAGIVTKTTASGMILRCSDGVGPSEFSDLEAEISIET